VTTGATECRWAGAALSQWTLAATPTQFDHCREVIRRD
jgi:hypothetical protein